MTSPERFLAVPIAAVEINWLAANFLPSVQNAIAAQLSEGGILWVPTDSEEEGEFLLSRLATDCNHKGLFSAITQTVPHLDPWIFWNDFIGSAEVAGTWINLPTGCLLIVLNGWSIPRDSLIIHAGLIEHIVNGKSVRFVFSIPRGFQPPEELHCAQFISEVPSLQNTNPVEIEAMVACLVESRIPSLTSTQLKSVTKRILSARPSNRTQIELWLSMCVDFEDAEARVIEVLANPKRGLEARYNIPPRHPQLAERFGRSVITLKACKELLSPLHPEPLYYPHQPLTDPFSCVDPQFWFSGMVSYLSCLLFDSGRVVLQTIGRFQFDPTRGDIVAAEATPFLDTLRSLRTTMQHGLDPASSHNREVIGATQDWYVSVCGSPIPTRYHARMLTHQLLADWEEFIESAHLVLSHLNGAGSAKVVFGELERTSSTLSTDDIYRLVGDVVKSIDPSIDIERLIRLHRETIISKMNGTFLSGANRDAKARSIIERLVAEESAKCPLDAKWLQSQGIKPGKRLGQWLTYFRTKWESCQPSGDAVEFLMTAQTTVEYALLESVATDGPIPPNTSA